MKKIDIVKEFESIEGKKGTYRMMLAHGESIVYQDGNFGTYWRKGNTYDQAPTWMGKEKALKRATDYLLAMNELEKKGADFYGFELADRNFWK